MGRQGAQRPQLPADQTKLRLHQALTFVDLVGHLLELRRQGLADAPLLEQAGIAPALLQRPYARVSAQAYARLWRAIAAAADDEFFGIVKWVGYALIEAEEYGVTQANADSMKTSTNPNIMRLVGAGTEDTGKILGLDKEWALRAIKAVGNYGEQFERHVGPKTPIALPRGTNNLWTKGGLMYAPPVR